MRPEKYSFIARLYRFMRVMRFAIVLLVMVSTMAKGQDQTNFTQFFLNPYLYNPSYVGIDGQPAVTLAYKKQWMGIEGAPALANLSFQAPLSPRAGFGLSVTNDSRGLLNNSSLLLSFGFNVPLAEHAFVRFGISGGGSWNMVDMGKLEAMNDDLALGNILDNNASVTGNAGISFHIKTFQLGASMPTMFSPSYLSEDEFTITEIDPFRSIIVNASNRFYFGDDKHIFEPYVLYRINADLPPQFEVAGIVHLNHTIWVGGSYKEDFGISALGGIKVKHSLAIGASYSLQNSGANELNSPSFDINLSFLLGKRKKNAPVYSFVNTEKEKEKKPLKKSASELIAEKRKAEEEARKKQLEEQARIKKEQEAAQERTEELARKAKEEEEQRARQEEEQRARLAAQEQQIARNTAAPVNQTPVEKKETVTDNGRHETFKRGAHAKELGSGDYVIAGVFSTEANANRYAQGLRQLGYLANYGFLTQKQLWYVHVYRSEDVNQARAERDKFRKLRMFKDAWLLTVVN